jgi:hypothetical protein
MHESSWASHPFPEPTPGKQTYAGPRVATFGAEPQPITATAHKLARIIFHILTTKQSYNESIFQKSEEQPLRRAKIRLRRQAAQLGFHVIAPENC